MESYIFLSLDLSKDRFYLDTKHFAIACFPFSERKEQVISVGKIGTKPMTYLLTLPFLVFFYFFFKKNCTINDRTRLRFFKSERQNKTMTTTTKYSHFWTSYIQVSNLCDLKKRDLESPEKMEFLMERLTDS